MLVSSFAAAPASDIAPWKSSGSEHILRTPRILCQHVYVSGHTTDWLRFGLKCILAAALLLLLAWLAGVIAGPTPQQGTIEFEYRKFLMQFLMVVAVGAVVKYLVDRSAKQRDEYRSLLSNATLRAGEFLTSLTAIYSDTKDIRVLIEVVVREPHDLDKDTYMGAMTRVRSGQQALERLQDRAEELEVVMWRLSAEARTDREPRLLTSVCKMEAYLGALTDEWRGVAAKWKDREPSPEPLPRLYAFVRRTAEEDFNGDFKNFSSSYKDARRVVLNFLAIPLRNSRPDARRSAGTSSAP